MPGPNNGGDAPVTPKDMPANISPAEAKLYTDAYNDKTNANKIAADSATLIANAEKSGAATVDKNGVIHFTDKGLYDTYEGYQKTLKGYGDDFDAKEKALEKICDEKHDWKLKAALEQDKINGIGCNDILKGTGFEQYAAAAMLFQALNGDDKTKMVDEHGKPLQALDARSQLYLIDSLLKGDHEEPFLGQDKAAAIQALKDKQAELTKANPGIAKEVQSDVDKNPDAYNVVLKEIEHTIAAKNSKGDADDFQFKDLGKDKAGNEVYSYEMDDKGNSFGSSAGGKEICIDSLNGINLQGYFET